MVSPWGVTVTEGWSQDIAFSFAQVGLDTAHECFTSVDLGPLGLAPSL